MTTLIQQPFSGSADSKGMRGKVKPQDIKSGTYFGQVQLRGSILAIKDAQDTTSGYLAFGTSMTTVPSSPTSGTGVYIDYSGIRSLNSGTPQIVLDDNGLLIQADGTDYVRWFTATNDDVANISADNAGNSSQLEILSNDSLNNNSGAILLQAFGGASSAALFAFANGTDNYFNLVTVNGTTLVGIGFNGVPSSLLHLKSTAPALRMEDTTSSAKSLLLTVDANIAKFQEAAGTDVFGLDLANRRVGVRTNAPTSTFHVADSTIRIENSRTIASAGANGFAGELCWDSSYIYLCTATNTWRRVAHTTW